jgi:hypothetical protein
MEKPFKIRMVLGMGAALVGLLCLLAVLSFVLPAGKVVFMVGDSNVPMVPVTILAGVGLMLFVGARER